MHHSPAVQIPAPATLRPASTPIVPHRYRIYRGKSRAGKRHVFLGVGCFQQAVGEHVPPEPLQLAYLCAGAGMSKLSMQILASVSGFLADAKDLHNYRLVNPLPANPRPVAVSDHA